MTSSPVIARTRPAGSQVAAPAARGRAATAIALGVWAALIAVSAIWGEHVVAVGDRLRIHAPPLAGDYRDRFGPELLAPIGVAAGVLVLGPRGSRRWGWPYVLGAAMAASMMWAVALGLNDGWEGLTSPLVRGQYIRTVPKVGDPIAFLSSFVDRLPSYNIHTQGHPPGMVLVLWVLDRVGLGGTGPNLALVLAGGAASVAAALVVVREVVDERTARRAAPFLALAPAMIWWSSGDAFFAGVGGWSIALVVLATGRSGRRADLLAVAGGALFGVTLLLSYGLVLLALVPVFVAIDRRRARPLGFATLGAAAVLLAPVLAGFWWLDGFQATRERYWAGVAARRPYSYFLVGNLGAFALALGPAAAAGLARLRDRRMWLLVGAGLAAVLLADLSGMSKAEVERIWLPFAPWVLLATAALGGEVRGARSTRAWLGAQAAIAIAIQATVRSPW